MEFVKKSIDESALHKREYDNRVNERQMYTKERKVDTGIALDASLVVTKSIGTCLGKHDTSSISGYDTYIDDANIRPSYDEEQMAKDAKQCHDKRPLNASLTKSKIIELLNQSLESENSRLKKTVVQFQKVFSEMKAHCIAF
ncbi:hypothetical protein Tco_0516201 [Tanacetum coccineum]